MLKIRIIPILTFNGIGLVKTKKFASPRMIGNPVQAARIYNSRGVDELLFFDIMASIENRIINLSIARDVVKECFMPVAIGGGITTIEDIKNILRIGADKVVIKNAAIINPDFIKHSVDFFGSQCVSVVADTLKVNNNFYLYSTSNTQIPVTDFIQHMEYCGAGEIILNSVNNDGMMEGFDLELYKLIDTATTLPIVMVGGGGNLHHYTDLFSQTNCNAVGSSSIFHFTQFTPDDIKQALHQIGKPVRIS